MTSFMHLTLNGLGLRFSLRAYRDGGWIDLRLSSDGTAEWEGLKAQLVLSSPGRFHLSFTSPFPTRLRLWLTPAFETRSCFHLIPGNIHGDNNAAHVRPGEFPCLTDQHREYRNCAALWEFRADRASHPVSLIGTDRGTLGLSIDPYAGEIRNGLFAALPNACGVSLGYGNDPLTFSEKTVFLPATADFARSGTANGRIFALPGDWRTELHTVIRALYDDLHERPTHRHTLSEALRALAEAFIHVNWSPELQQYTNRKCRRPVSTELQPWRAVVEIGWTGGSMMAYPFALAEELFPDLKFPKTPAAIFDEICDGWNDASGFINDTCINRTTRNQPQGWNVSGINGWWSGFLPQTRDNHCAYTNAHAAYYMLAMAVRQKASKRWIDTALRVLNTAIALQRADGAFGYVFSSREKKVVDWQGFAGCWFTAAAAMAFKLMQEDRYHTAAKRSLAFYAPFVRNLTAWGSPMDTYKSIDSEGNLAFIRAARLMHELTGEQRYLDMLLSGANYEYLWRYGFRSRPSCPPLSQTSWNSCGGSITSVSNPHLHPMSVVVTEDLHYLAKYTGDTYHASRADDGIAWLLQTMELYPDVTGYGRYGVLSERSCPSDGLLAEVFYDSNAPSSLWWSYNAWAAASAMEAIAERLLARN
jgi:hypothetical protein